jgi:hypothetical protein
MVFNATFNNISVILWQSVFIGGGKTEYPEKTTDLSQVTEDERLEDYNTYIHVLWCLTQLSSIFQLYRGSNIA